MQSDNRGVYEVLLHNAVCIQRFGGQEITCPSDLLPEQKKKKNVLE